SIIWKGGKDSGCLTTIEMGEIGQRTVAIVAQLGREPAQIWDLEQQKLLFEAQLPSLHAWLYRFRGKTLLIEVSSKRFTARRIVTKNMRRGVSLTDVDFTAPRGAQYSTIFRLQSRAAFLSAENDHLRVWDVD